MIFDTFFGNKKKNLYTFVNFDVTVLDTTEMQLRPSKHLKWRVLQQQLTAENHQLLSQSSPSQKFAGALATLLHTKATQFYNFFFSILVLCNKHSRFTGQQEKGKARGYLFNCSLQLPPTSQTLKHLPGDYCRDLTSALSQRPSSNQETLVSESKSLTTRIHALT